MKTQSQTPLTDGTWEHSRRSAEYCHGKDNKAAIWHDIACDMRDLCRGLEQDRIELSKHAPRKTYRFLACFRANATNYGGEYVAIVDCSFDTFLATQQHNPSARRAFLRDLTGHANPEPESLSVEVGGHFIPIY